MMTQKKAVCLSILGTGSDVGKSIVVTALCRIFRNQGIRVAPFKAQNMSNNSYVTPEGGEMGRAQVVQAEAAGIDPHVNMNPVLLKPNSDMGSQVIVKGKVFGNYKAQEYYQLSDSLFEKAQESLTELRQNYDLVIMEGAGSCGEVNLRERDFVNFKMAHFAEAPVILVGDIDRGGVFAQLIGTLAISRPEDQKRICGFIINKFRGDLKLFEAGVRYLEEVTQLPVLGVLPYYQNIQIEAEDSVLLQSLIDPLEVPSSQTVKIAVIRVPHISNYTDFFPLQREKKVTVHYLSQPRLLENYQAVILPGSKNVRSDLKWLYDTEWASTLQTYQKGGGTLVGICGGYQMLGMSIQDPNGVEGEPGRIEGLKMLDVETTLEKEKVLARSQGIFLKAQTKIEGYEIHMGLTRRNASTTPLIHVTQRHDEALDEWDGAISADGKIWGTYFHGLFDAPEFRVHFLKNLSSHYTPDPFQTAKGFKDHQYDLLAKHFEQYINIQTIKKIIGLM
ncbi:cobyric acid synthase [Deltaproteobacteria bacterium TL4]